MFSFQDEAWFLVRFPILLQLAGLFYIVRGLQGVWHWWNERVYTTPDCPLEKLARQMMLPGSLLALVSGIHLVADESTAWLSLTVLVLAQLVYLRRKFLLADRQERKVADSFSQQTLPVSLGLWLLSLLVSVSH
ncbi:hypothetical protein [Parathalassolituus penaei]|uniref:Uncharacterized protein n=1 Tax=Parathalassolituus penaei TaxID=2997323 RepID=A0A9X3EGC6_9GAMM|nr:hypothetical protein [Parathalassolituus penaei]MCY0967098.1 hypothetical protein [Parathalassolituus penaei]